MDAATRENHNQHGHQNRSDEEERADRNLHRSESQNQEDDEQHRGGGQTTNPHAVRILTHGVDGLVEDHRFGALTEHGEEAQHGKRGDHAQAQSLTGFDRALRVSHSHFGLIPDVVVPRFHGALVEHPVTGPQQHESGDKRAHAFGNLLNRAGTAEQERKEYGDQTGTGQTCDHAKVDPPSETLVAGLHQVGDHCGHHQQRFEALTDQNEERLAGGAGDEPGEAVDIAGRATVKGGRVFHEPALQIVDMLLDFLVGTAIAHDLTSHLELVFDLRNTIAGNHVHHVLFEAEFLVVLVVGVVDQRGAFGALAGSGGFVRLIENDGHFAGNVTPRAVAFAFGRILLGRVELLALFRGLRGTLLRVFLRIGEVSVRVERLRGCVDFGGQRVDFGCNGVALVLLVGKTFKIGELLQQFLLLVSADCVIDDLRKIGRVVANPMRGLKISTSLTVIAVIVVFFGGRKLVFDVLRSGSPGIKIRLTVIGGDCRLRDHGSREKRGQCDQQCRDERDKATERTCSPLRIAG